MVGGSSSVTVTVKLHEAVRPDGSVTVYVTVVTPRLKVCVPSSPVPLPIVAPAIVHESVEPVQLSPKVGSGGVKLALHEVLEVPDV